VTSARDAAALERAVAALRRGEVVAFPTESTYGLAVDARSPSALERLFALKRREPGKPPPLLVADRAMVDTLAALVPARAERLMADFWPGPLTLILPARAALPAAVTSAAGVGMRRSPHPMAQALCAGFGGAITASSANRSGEPPATDAAEVRAVFSTIEILDGGATPGGPPSTVVIVDEAGRLTVLRAGALDPGALSG
jgi:L-threonylcarbamoyladenylate synthase